MTARGIEQQHHLGGVIRRRYNSLLSPNYTRSEIVVRSTDVDRTLMSAQSNLVGLYPVSDPPAGTVPIQPIPIHTVPINIDFVGFSRKQKSINECHFVVVVFFSSYSVKVTAEDMIKSKMKSIEVTKCKNSMHTIKYTKSTDSFCLSVYIKLIRIAIL